MDNRYNKLAAYIDMSLHAFKNDPADSEYQDGYQDALLDLQRLIDDMENSDD